MRVALLQHGCIPRSLVNTTSTSIYMYYGNPAATEPAAILTYGSQNVWTNGYVGVWHTNDNNGTLNLTYSYVNWKRDRDAIMEE